MPNQELAVREALLPVEIQARIDGLMRGLGPAVAHVVAGGSLGTLHDSIRLALVHLAEEILK